jgi:hypothetical protein
MSTLAALQAVNPQRRILSTAASAFSRFGRILEVPYADELLNAVKVWQPDPALDTTYYEASIPTVEQLPAVVKMERDLFGEMPIQVGCCWGFNTRLNGMEFHKSSEVLGAATDLVLMLGLLPDAESRNGGLFWDSGRAALFYLPAGTFVELYAATLHLAPCRTAATPFTAVIILPRETNTPLSGGPDGMLWMRNKWLLAHPDSPAAAKGAWIGITGSNPEIVPVG